jgi:hypothetical protein
MGNEFDALHDWVPECSWVEAGGVKCTRPAANIAHIHDQLSADPNAFEWAYLCGDCQLAILALFKLAQGVITCSACRRGFSSIAEFAIEVQSLAPPIGSTE